MTTAMDSILILFAHPRFEKSRVNRALLAGLQGQPGITVHDLYEAYPDFNVDPEREQALLLAHRIIVWHYPLFLYGAPALVKQWMDLVLEHGWAHGSNGHHLAGKRALVTVTSGGTRESYAHDGFNRHTMPELLFPLEQAARLCRMDWLPPYVVQGTYRLTDAMLAEQGGQYCRTLLRLAQDPPLETLQQYELLNDWSAAMEHGGQP